MQYKRLSCCLALTGSMLVPLTATAGAKLKIDDESSIDLGFRVQAMYLNHDKKNDTNEDDFRVRRARFRLKGDITKWVTAFLQTDVAQDRTNDPGTSVGEDVRLIDAWVMVKPHNLFNITGGLHMPAVTRENLTSSGGLLAMDRPGINNYILGWGSSGRKAFNTAGLAGTGSGLDNDGFVRDRGVSLFGKTSFNDTTHFKYYAGIFEGSNTRVGDPERYSGRVQLNFFDPEPGYFQVATYLGKKKTVGIGLGFDSQDAVANDSLGAKADYEMWSIDGFAEWPVGPGSLTAEAAYSDMDIDGGDNPLQDSSGNTLPGASAANQAKGKGYYLQGGYYINKWQPWAMYETWDADGINDAGDWNAWRVGVSYYIKGHNAAIKAGYETIKNDTPNTEDVDTFAVGFYTTY